MIGIKHSEHIISLKGVQQMGLKNEKLNMEKADISGSLFKEVNAAGLEFDNVNLANSKINNVNMSNMTIHDVNCSGIKITDANLSHLEIAGAQMGGAFVHNIVIPKEDDPFYNADTARLPVRFEKCEFVGAQIIKCDLSNVNIEDCNISGLKINGIFIEELIKNRGE